MNKRQREIIQAQLVDEEKILYELKKIYRRAEKDIDAKIAALLARNDTENLSSIIYQVDYQRSLKAQIGAILDQLNTEQFTSISDYLAKCYENGFLGTLYDLQGQGIPLIFPIDQKQVTQAIVNDSKLSKRLYTRLGEDVDELKKKVRMELSRGISQAYSYEQIAKNIRNQTKIGFNRSMRIARTEGHRVSQQATYDSQTKAKDAGADIVKQWDSTLDTRTRDSHVAVDGEIRELDEKFSNGLRYPGDSSGAASEVVNCRCVLLQRARWAVEGKGVYTKFDGTKGQLVDLSDEENFADFKKRYKEEIKPVDPPPQKELTKAQKDAVEYYVSGDGMYINNPLRGRANSEGVTLTMDDLDDGERALIKDLDDATDRVLEPQTLYRSVDASAVFGDMSDMDYENLRNRVVYGAKDKYAMAADKYINGATGKTITDNGFMSTTTNYEVASEFGDFTGSEKPIVLELTTTRNTKGLSLAKEMPELNELMEQDEVLLHRGQKYKILSVSSKDGNIYVQAIMIDAE